VTVLGDIAKVIDCEHRTAPGTDRKPFGYSVGTRAVRGGRISIEDAKPVSKETYLSWTRRATPAAGDLIFSREAPMAKSEPFQPAPLSALASAPSYCGWISSRWTIDSCYTS